MNATLISWSNTLREPPQQKQVKTESAIIIKICPQMQSYVQT